VACTGLSRIEPSRRLVVNQAAKQPRAFRYSVERPTFYSSYSPQKTGLDA